jgi:lipopolysaccharide biosynthesis regulator YciM
VAFLLCAAAGAVNADQYHSEVRDLDTTPAQTKPQDEQKLLQITTDPYAKSMLLRDLASAAVAKKDFGQAAKYLEQALAQNGLSGVAAEQMKKDLSQIYLANGNYKDLIPQLEAQVKAGNAASETLIALGAAYLEKKRYKEALPLLQKGVASTKTPDLSWKRALLSAMLGSGQDKDAIPLADQLVREDPTHPEDWLRLAALNLKAGNKERARAVMELASRLGYLTSEADRLRLVTLTAQLGAPFEGASTLQSWMDAGLVQKNGTNWRTLAAMWIAARESSLAIPALEQSISRAPSAELYQQLAQMQMNREEYAAAAEALQRAIGLGAKSGPVFMSLGMARYQQADVDSALQAFNAAGEYPQSRKLAQQWIKYLESGKAREQALAAAKERRQHNDDVTLSSRLLGGTVSVSAGEGAATSSQAGSGKLTPIGAEQSANADGSIPAWNGGLAKSQWPASFKPGGRLADPYPGDKPLLTITAANASQYRDRLSKGHLALLARYPDYTIPVYTTRRGVSYPQAIYDATQANIGKAKLTGSDALEGARLGFPFPKPENGVEIMWNHRVRFRGNTVQLQSTQAVVATDGDTHTLKQTERVLYRYGNIKDPSNLSSENILLYYLTWFGKTRSDVDFLALVHETANSIKQGRNIWVAPPKIPRMFRIPPVGYDQPFPGADGLMFIDMVDMYNGAFDRYVWKLAGKHELYIPYNGYHIGDGRYAYAQLLKPHHFNQEATRYELHRVWVIEATERQGKRHSFGKRVFYVDEDSWNVVLVENYDHDGNLWRMQEGHLLPMYDVQSANCAPVITYDLKDGRYFANRLTGEDTPPQYDLKMTPGEFMSDSVKARYVH